MSAGKGLALLACCLSVIALVSAEDKFRYKQDNKYYVVAEGTPSALGAPKLVAELHATRKNAEFYLGGNKWAVMGCNKNETTCGVWIVDLATANTDVVQNSNPNINLTSQKDNFATSATRVQLMYAQQRLLIKLDTPANAVWMSDCAMTSVTPLYLSASFGAINYVTKRMSAFVTTTPTLVVKLTNLTTNETVTIDQTDKAAQLQQSIGFRTSTGAEFYFMPGVFSIKVVRNNAAAPANCADPKLSSAANVTDLTLGLADGFSVRAAFAPGTTSVTGDSIYLLVVNGTGAGEFDTAKVMRLNVSNETAYIVTAATATVPYPAATAKVFVVDSTTAWYRSKDNKIVKVAYTATPITETHTTAVGNGDSGTDVFFEAVDEIHIYNSTGKTIYKQTLATPAVNKVAENVTVGSTYGLWQTSGADYDARQDLSGATFTCQSSQYLCDAPPPSPAPAGGSAPSSAPTAPAVGSVQLSFTAPGNKTNVTEAIAKAAILADLGSIATGDGITVTINSIDLASKAFQTLERRMQTLADKVKITFTISNIPQSQLSGVTQKVKDAIADGKIGTLTVDPNSVVQISITGLPAPSTPKPSSGYSLLASWKMLSAVIGIALLKMLM